MEQKEKKEIKNESTLIGIYDEELRRLESRVGKDRSANTYKAMKQGRRYVVLFLEDKMHKEDLFLSELTPQMIYDFSVYLSAERELRGGTVWLTCQQLKGVVNRAYQRGVLTWNPFAGFHIAKKIRPREYLTEEELERLINYHFDKHSLSFARDIFLFSAFTGLSYIDICELRQTDIVKIGDSTWIISKRHKTKIPYQVRLFDVPLSILRRYQSIGNETVFGNLEYRSLAHHIHLMMEEVGLRKSITMHCARHTFAVLAINKGMPIESLSRILGHANITTTQIYAKITMKKLETDMKKLEKSLNIINKM